jgi:hypothetical protein
MPQLSKEIIEAAIQGFESQKRRIDAQVAELRAMLSPNSSAAPPSVPKKRGMSKAGRNAIAEAQRKRWAASKGEPSAPDAAKKPKRKRRLSAAGKANIVAALKKRWAEKKAATENSVSKKAGQKKAA